MDQEPRSATIHELVGGDAFFVDLVDRFYDGVADDPVLRPMYPEDLTESRRLLAAFLAQFWGGPPAYSEERGHPRLRMRHVPFPVDLAARDAWLHHMLAAVDESDATPEIRAAMTDYFVRSADFLRNTEG
jgi:hemoglobin